MKTEHVLIIEDDPDIANLLRLDLEDAGYCVSHAGSVIEGLAQFHATTPDLIVLDLGLPDGPGNDVIAEVRPASTVPIIVLTARGMVEEKVEVLALGADDYITKPFALDEVLARIAVQFRRLEPVESLSYGGLKLLPNRLLATYQENEIFLSPIEFGILAFLMKSPGRVYSREEMSTQLWTDGLDPESNVLDVHLSNIRNKFRSATGQALIRNVRGIGFALKL